MLFLVSLLVDGALTGAIYALIALAFVVVYKASRVINFALGEWVMLGSLLTAAGAATLGLSDGEALRLQGGARIGADWVGPDRHLWSVSFLAAVYSDVMVNGFTAPGGGTGVTLATDEGKVRALGQLRAKVTTRDGISYYVQGEVRGGEDYWGVGGKAGVRLEW